MTSKLSHSEKRAAQILDVIMSYARLEFDVKTPLSNDGDIIDAIAAGVNMLGEELKSSSITVREKDQLLREIHHRVKNNMQIISSLLNLQSGNEKDKRFLAMIKESRNRINAMAFIHELLYATSDFKYTNCKDYVHKLTESLSRSYAEGSSDVNYNISIDPKLKFDVDTMIPLGLIINEIVTNSFKYAFPKKTKGKCISVELKQAPKKKHVLSISDNGIGLPKGFNRKKQSSLGMQLIFLLAEQIEGGVELKTAKGTHYSISF